MFIDASVIVAILNQEPGWQELAKRLAHVENACAVSPLVRFEAMLGIARAAVHKRSGPGTKPDPMILQESRKLVDDLIAEIGATEIAITNTIGNGAMDAAAMYGKAIGHPADLNFGDCFAYACAKAYGSGLLYKGDDFAQTDLA
ncbi:type II toxin-antitoxin system VapC family toxin [Rhizobium rhizogenes]|uniref:type II toxin-antitoxin system VapC family toxin n=1 Tax=Rhizobium rhizogenes TaxID=359 RepID=UPI0015738EDF|nr:type II toxin-antitoxin system VapC family toxin [Rhizobium rhizogenes]NTG40672.1 type II toxin-antitoxin system VapC family toxin [Rhizobium rhizogenes]NTI28296.1 type II toxin-antitoxin system VapC family toxin [Rhizobium rhizogenes]